MALRISLRGQTPLSSQFYLQRDNWFNEVLSVAQQATSSGVWLESLKVQTTEPAGTDSNTELSDLGSLVMQNLQAEHLQVFVRESAWPPEVTQMLNKLASKQRREIEATLLTDISALDTTSPASGATNKAETGVDLTGSGKLASEHLLGEVSNLVNAAVRGKMVAAVSGQTDPDVSGKPTPETSGKPGTDNAGSKEGQI